MGMAEAFAAIAIGFSSAMGGPYWPAVARWPGVPVMDDGGSIVSPGVPINMDCQAQVDESALRYTDGYVEGEVRILVLAATLTGPLDTEMRIEVLDGPHVGMWMCASLERDPASIGWIGQGRRA